MRVLFSEETVEHVKCEAAQTFDAGTALRLAVSSLPLQRGLCHLVDKDRRVTCRPELGVMAHKTQGMGETALRSSPSNGGRGEVPQPKSQLSRACISRVPEHSFFPLLPSP